MSLCYAAPAGAAAAAAMPSTPRVYRRVLQQKYKRNPLLCSRQSNHFVAIHNFASCENVLHTHNALQIFPFCLVFRLRAGEVERLLKEYRENQELVRRIGKHHYQIIYPVQLRHHEKMGISTREVSAAKVRNRLRKRNTFDTVCSSL